MPAKHRRVRRRRNQQYALVFSILSRLFKRSSIFMQNPFSRPLFTISSTFFPVSKASFSRSSAFFRCGKYRSKGMPSRRDLLLRIGFAVHQPVAHADHRRLPALRPCSASSRMLCRLTRRSTSPCTASGSVPSTSISVISLPSPSVPMGSCRKRPPSASGSPAGTSGFRFDASGAVGAELRPLSPA